MKYDRTTSPHSVPPCRRRRPGIPSAALLAGFLLLLVAGCGGDATGPDIPEPLPTPVPGGVLLEGADSVPAAAALRLLPPSPAELADIRPDGLLASRLTALLGHDATVGTVNAALEANGARIVCMRPGSPLLSLVIAPVADAEAARARAADLDQADAFALVYPSYEVRPDRPVAGTGRGSASDKQTSPLPAHLLTARVAAAWNVKQLALANNQKVVVLVPDNYHQLTPHPAIPGQTFLAPAGAATPGKNHGFHVAGILAADPASPQYSGIHPAPAQLLEVRSIPVGGLAWDALVNTIPSFFPPTGHFVINTSLGYNDSTFATYPKIERAIEAVTWRILAAPVAGRLLHANSAGNTGESVNPDGAVARYGSPFRAHAGFPDLAVLADEDTTATEQQQLEFALLAGVYPEAAVPPGNTLMVGSSDVWGEMSSYSCAGENVRMVGEKVPGPCVVADTDGDPDGCDGSVAHYWGTSMASPQVAGLAAYMWNLAPSRTPEQIRTLLHHAYATSPRPGVLDAYIAVLGLDNSLDDPRIRLALLDVAGNADTPGQNGAFDHHDVKVLVDQWAASAAAGYPVTGYERYDLNGDGESGDQGPGAPFDLDVNQPPAFTAVTQTIGGEEVTFEEQAVDDFGILCYYAHSSLFSGDEAARDILLAGQCGGGGLELNLGELYWHNTMTWDNEPAYFVQTVEITAHYFQDGVYVGPAAGASVSLTAQGGSLDAAAGVLDDEGRFLTLAYPTHWPPADSLVVNISVNSDGGSSVATRLVAHRERAEAVPPTHIVCGASTSAWAGIGNYSGPTDEFQLERDSETDFSDFTAQHASSSSASDPECGSISVDNAADLDIHVATDPTTGSLTGLRISGSVENAASYAITNSNCGGGNWNGAASWFYLDFEVPVDSVPLAARVTGVLIGSEGRARLAAQIGVYDDIPTAPISVEGFAEFGEGANRIAIQLVGAPLDDGGNDGVSFDLEFEFVR